MLIREWMTQDVITVTPDTSMMKASKILKENRIRRLPVVDAEGRLIGIVSDRDIKEASPSKATTLDMHELYYLLSEIKVKDIMTRDPFTVRADDTVETVALNMIEKRIGGLPVIDDAGKLVGIISDSDVFKVLITITGVRHGGVQFAFELENTPGTLKPIVDTLREHNARIISILTSMDDSSGPTRRVYIRILPMDRAEENRIIEAVKSRFSLMYWARDNVHPA
ncbi:CBS domain-containing protein [Nitratidesulfovibrio liaohensis]|uniref:CBS domain-containing protein n=1 Tax=Nitratidesulfovibrio liaohensis TaxID=2604158 RepID=A0ABY9R0M9_9BACT|nr:CBS domain-containing protein [Nitratidesulfovibrio liaohensis]NHZ45579.1 CBS domain-containing protein [Nitratidesulfovibrio liaohensis]WMW65177.1 CBS domain-containing protein [Nitratidesulfovibrio liaohensis]